MLATYTASQKSDTNEQPDNLAGWLPLGDPIIVPEDATELTIAVSKPETDEDLLRTDAVALGLTAKVTDVVFRQETGPGYGALDEENPDGTFETPDFQGGFRLFPGAQSAAAPDQANNVVRVRAILKGMTDDDIGMTKVLFRSFDVDDPSGDATIDPNGATANDNRGRLMNVPFGQDGAANGGLPATSADGGPFSGYLRPIKADGTAGAWQALVEGRTEADAVVQKEGDTFFAEVDLATSYAPGDNFRVAAVIGDDNKDDLRAADADDVPTSPAADGDAFATTDQLSVWRYFHIEQDRMATTASAGTQAGNITAAAAPVDGKVVLSLDVPIIQDDRYENGVLRTGGTNYEITSNDRGERWGADIAAVDQIGATEYLLTLDFGVLPIPITVAAGEWVSGKIVVLDDQFALTESQYTIVAHNSGEFEQFVDVQVMSDEAVPLGRIRLFEPNAKVTVESAAAIPLGAMTIYEDDFAPPAGDPIGLPVTIVDTADDGRNAAMYGFVQDTTIRRNNRYADAYLAPRTDTLDAFDSVIPSDPSLGTADALRAVYANHSGAASIESDLFWAVHVYSAYESLTISDFDPNGEPAEMGQTVTDEDGGPFVSSAIYLEAIRDRFPVVEGVAFMSESEYSAAVTAHEIGHQFDLSTVSTTSIHADDEPNVMSSGSIIVADFRYYFLAEDVAALRSRTSSPGAFV